MKQEIYREYGLGRMRTDLLIEWKNKSKFVLELKTLYKVLEKTISDRTKQTWGYIGKTDTDIGRLLIFDKTEGKNRNEKIFRIERV